MPTRFAKELTQIIRGGVAIGMNRDQALKLAIRCARDSMPPVRLQIIDDLASNADSTTSDVRRRINKPWTTVDRQLQALHMLGVLDVVEDSYGEKNRWYYSLAADVDPTALDPNSSPEMSVDTPNALEKREGSETDSCAVHLPTDISGEGNGDHGGVTTDVGQPTFRATPGTCCQCYGPLLNNAQRDRGTCGPCWLSERRSA
jgi:hypothetical protein